MPTESLLDGYPSRLAINIQWGDMDALLHVNNTVHFRWYESSRIAYLEESGISTVMDSMQIGPILAAVNCNYKRQLRYPDRIQVGCKLARLGRSSLTLQHIVVSDELGQEAADGESVVVMFDFENQRPVRIPEEVRGKISQFESDTM